MKQALTTDISDGDMCPECEGLGTITSFLMLCLDCKGTGRIGKHEAPAPDQSPNLELKL